MDWRKRLVSALSAAEPDKTYTERLIDDALEQGDIQKATDLGKQGLKSTTSALATAGLLATGAGAFGALPADIVNTSFGIHGAYNAASKNGIRKTIRLAREHDIPGAIQSGLGDALDLTMGLNTLRLGTRLGKSLIKGSTLGNAYRSDVAGRELANNIKQLNFIPAQVKYYGPTMGKSYAAKTNPNLIDLDTWGRPEYDKLAKKYGYKDWREMILSNKGDYNKEYKSLIKDQIHRIQSNPQYSGKTIVVSNASLLNPDSRITFANIPTIPDRAIMAERNHVRHPWESIEHGESWWDSLQSKGTPLKIDNRFVSEIEGNKTINFIPKQDLAHTHPLSKIEQGYASKTATKGNLKNLDYFIENDIFPRLKRAGHNVEYNNTIMPQIRVFNPSQDVVDAWLQSNGVTHSGAWFHPYANTATFRQDPTKVDFNLLLHEVGGHGIRHNINPDYKPISWEQLKNILSMSKEHNIPMENIIIKDLKNAEEMILPKEKELLLHTYKQLFKGGRGEDKIGEYLAVNTQLRGKISQQNNYAVDKQLDRIIDNYSDGKLMKLLIDQPYTTNGFSRILSKEVGRDITDDISNFKLNKIASKSKNIQKILNNIRETMKYVGAVSIPLTITNKTKNPER